MFLQGQYELLECQGYVADLTFPFYKVDWKLFQSLLSRMVGNSLFRSCRSFPLVILLKVATRANRSCHSLHKKQERIALVALFKRVTGAKWVDHSFHFFEHKSDSLFMKERFTLLRVGFAPFWRENWKLDLKIYITLFVFAFIKKEWIALFKRAIRSSSLCSFKKRDDSESLLLFS